MRRGGLEDGTRRVAKERDEVADQGAPEITRGSRGDMPTKIRDAAVVGPRQPLERIAIGLGFTVSSHA